MNSLSDCADIATVKLGTRIIFCFASLSLDVGVLLLDCGNLSSSLSSPKNVVAYLKVFFVLVLISFVILFRYSALRCSETQRNF
jgi:hypothetical protein